LIRFLSLLLLLRMSKTKSIAEDGAISFHVADGRLGYPVVAPYNVIHVGAAAPLVSPRAADAQWMNSRLGASQSFKVLMIKFGKVRKIGLFGLPTRLSGFDSFRAKLRNELNLKI
jgi:hypothetical protein